MPPVSECDYHIDIYTLLLQVGFVSTPGIPGHSQAVIVMNWIGCRLCVLWLTLWVVMLDTDFLKLHNHGMGDVLWFSAGHREMNIDFNPAQP